MLLWSSYFSHDLDWLYENPVFLWYAQNKRSEPKKITINLSKRSIPFGDFHLWKHPYDQTLIKKTLHVLCFFQWFLHDYVFSFSHKTRMHYWSWMPRSSCMYSWKMSEPLLHHYLWSQCWMQGDQTSCNLFLQTRVWGRSISYLWRT